jgi:hypothetical protein
MAVNITCLPSHPEFRRHVIQLANIQDGGNMTFTGLCCEPEAKLYGHSANILSFVVVA